MRREVRANSLGRAKKYYRSIVSLTSVPINPKALMTSAFYVVIAGADVLAGVSVLRDFFVFPHEFLV